MSNIKVRGWHVSQKRMYSAEEMATDQLTLLPTGQFINVNGYSTQLSRVFSKEEFIPLLWTGKLDKNGVEIYEDDSVQRVGVYRVVLRDGGWWLVNSTASFALSQYESSAYEVVGDIYTKLKLMPDG